MLTYILIGIITLLIICYFGYRYIIRLTGLGVNILFIIGCAGALSVIIAPEYYQEKVDYFLMEQSLYNDLVDLEKSVLKIQDFEDYIPFDFDIPFEGGLSTGIAETLNLLLTTIIFVLSVVAMLISIYLRYTITGYADTRKINKKVRQLERFVVQQSRT